MNVLFFVVETPAEPTIPAASPTASDANTNDTPTPPIIDKSEYKE